MKQGTNSNWISVSDMMSGLMMVFLFISVAFMNQISEEKKAVERIAMTYQDYQEDLYRSLVEEFGGDLDDWDAVILQDGTIRFLEPDVLFDPGSQRIKFRFKQVLAQFFPRYIKLLSSIRYKDNIEEIRIEGHTSSGWNGRSDFEQRYLNNAKLSQSRSFVILDYCFRLATVAPEQDWLTKVLRANGLAFAKPVYVAGREDAVRSRRVEFKVRTKADEKIREILQSVNESKL